MSLSGLVEAGLILAVLAGVYFASRDQAQRRNAPRDRR